MPPRESGYPKLDMPPTVERTSVTVWSNGVALDADVYRPKGLGGDKTAPAVVLSHGWGGDKLTPERYAAKFAAAGIVSLCFTYNGWGSSGETLHLVGDRPALDDKGEGTARVRVVRQVVDPVEWVQNYSSAIDYIEGEPNVDPDRIGAWGTSFGGRIATYVAANDDRIKVLSLQVTRIAALLKEPLRAQARQLAIDIARGKAEAVPAVDAFSFHPGRPHLARFRWHTPIDELSKVNIPTLIIDAGSEELFDIREQGGKAYEILKSKDAAPVKYEIIDGIDHYGVYYEGYEKSSDMARDWFVKYL